MRRLLIVACSSLGLVACASILGDFDVVPAGPSAPDGAVSNDGAVSEGGPTSEAGVDAGIVGVPTIVAVNQYATCANVGYGATDTSYCWGASGLNAPAYLGVTATDPREANIWAQPHVAGSSTPLVLSNVIGSNSGSWFLAAATEGEPQGGALPDAYAWGANPASQTGVPSKGGADELPHLLKEGGNAVAPLKPSAAAAGQTHGCVINAGNLYCWGSNSSCESTGSALPTCTANQTITTPTKVTILSNVVYDKVAVGQDHTCVIAHSSSAGPTPKGTIYCWGSNGLLQSGQKPPTTTVTLPTQPDGLVLDNALVSQLDIGTGDNHTCARVKDSVWCWGSNIGNQVAPGDPTTSKAPTKLGTIPGGVAAAVVLGGTVSCVVTATVENPPVTSVNCFGSGPLLARPAANANDLVGPVAGLTGIKSLSIGKNHACAVGHLDGEPAGTSERVLCWGKNASLGVDPTLATTADQATPHPVPLPIH